MSKSADPFSIFNTDSNIKTYILTLMELTNCSASICPPYHILRCCSMTLVDLNNSIVLLYEADLWPFHVKNIAALPKLLLYHSVSTM